MGIMLVMLSTEGAGERGSGRAGASRRMRRRTSSCCWYCCAAAAGRKVSELFITCLVVLLLLPNQHRRIIVVGVVAGGSGVGNVGFARHICGEAAPFCDEFALIFLKNFTSPIRL